ncbi:transglycosylase SLT domain-containing protein [Kushneria indalinina]|uniref:Transglycosylase-like protein with SLT domain n=1 Tax=Kushneria indalinina DSM 14324 TaxID=1122140 RepID=A0A3D9DRI4_9GAMM|nr:transglycosylase SLT domain-containing protein [Kushneria indalinina]REC93353.1 transglycosylase-like protein with SLT domain [Kushneria indalinina DSM 14324]
MQRAMVAIAAVGTALTAAMAHGGQPDIPSAYVSIAKDHGVPPKVLYAVASQESKQAINNGHRPWPWTLNVAGKSMYFGDRESACLALTDALNKTQIVDVGITQLNVRWQPQLFGAGRRFSDPCSALDPYANLEEAAVLIRGHYDAAGDWLIAVGRYHRPAGGKPAERYRASVSRELAKLGATPSMGTASPTMMAARDTSTQASSSKTIPTKLPTESAPAEDQLTWVTPAPRPHESDIAWVTPEQRRWMAEVASR